MNFSPWQYSNAGIPENRPYAHNSGAETPQCNPRGHRIRAVRLGGPAGRRLRPRPDQCAQLGHPGYVDRRGHRLADRADRRLGIVYRAIVTHLTHKAGYTKTTAQAGAVTLIQNFGGHLISTSTSTCSFWMVFTLTAPVSATSAARAMTCWASA